MPVLCHKDDLFLLVPQNVSALTDSSSNMMTKASEVKGVFLTPAVDQQPMKTPQSSCTLLQTHLWSEQTTKRSWGVEGSRWMDTWGTPGWTHGTPVGTSAETLRHRMSWLTLAQLRLCGPRLSGCTFVNLIKSQSSTSWQESDYIHFTTLQAI